MKHQFFEKHQFVANFLAKFQNAYESLDIGNKSETHIFIANKLELTKSSFQMLKSEYDGFYDLRKGLPNPYERKTRFEHKIKYDNFDFESYLTLVKLVLQNPEINIE